MLNKKLTGILLASSMFAALSASPVFASIIDTASGIGSERYETEVAEESNQNDLFSTLEERQQAGEAELEKGRANADSSADVAEEAAGVAKNYAEETEGQEIEEAAETAALEADNARAAADLAAIADDSRTVEMAAEIADAAKEAAKEAAAKAKEGAEAEAAAKEEEMLASAEYLGTFKLTAYCNCARCCGTAGNATASGVMPTSGHTVAMGGIDFGTKLLINGTVYTVEDRGTPYGHVDIFMDSHSEALQFGMSSADVYLIKE